MCRDGVCRFSVKGVRGHTDPLVGAAMAVHDHESNSKAKTKYESHVDGEALRSQTGIHHVARDPKILVPMKCTAAGF